MVLFAVAEQKEEEEVEVIFVQSVEIMLQLGVLIDMNPAFCGELLE
jgi:hypothetical protein